MIIISNIAVFLGALAILIVNGDKYRKLGAWLGLIAQPAWFYIAVSTEQWGVFAGAILYTFGWIRGVLPPAQLVREKIWYAPMILIGMKAVILKTWLRGWFKLILYRDPANGKCYKEWVAGENYNIFGRE